MTEKRGLGRGLSELGLNELLADINCSSSSFSEDSELKKLSIEKLQPSHYQPRRHINKEALEELASSIRSQGIIQPIVVRSLGTYYEIIAGERRWRAAQLAGLKEIPVVIRSISNEAAMAISLIENIQRQNLNVIEEGIALQRLLNKFAMTHEEVAEAVGKSRANVTNLLRLLKLNADVRQLVEEGHLNMGHARALLAVEGVCQSNIAKDIANKGLSVRETEKIIRQLQESGKSEILRTFVDPDIARLQKDLSDKLGATVAIRHNPKGKGKLVIHYNSTDELEGILERIR
ncbi:ParB/RepB/Spo0J family partition protein [Coxiella-like endosymbiont]|uniref:ParB/RepB/Spo0J family partition protein n=1 Tax=Coxiella-like endosymbiont TaxID=1592897 RepID=UPI00272B1EF7|nr:ParB/RepB/Spo0J family partition protein [Coxiella-like endosymbiont]